MLGAGQLRERITLESPVTVRDEIGGESEKVWIDQGSTWAEIAAVTGRESTVAQQIEAVVTTRVVIRPRPDVQPTWRIRWGRAILSIEAVLPFAAKDRLTLLCSQGIFVSDT